MRLSLIFLSFLYASCLSTRRYTPCTDADCAIQCSASSNRTNPEIPCSFAIIDASNATRLSLSCTDRASCLNTTIICPVGNDTYCEILCLDSFSCDAAVIQSESTITTLNCLSPSGNASNICTNNVSLALSPLSSAFITCAQESAISSPPTTVCDGLSVFSTAAANSETVSSLSMLSFKCSNATCNGVHLDMPQIAMLSVAVSVDSIVNGSRFVNNQNMSIRAAKGATIKNSRFSAPAAFDDSNVSIILAPSSLLIDSELMFDGISSFYMAGYVNGDDESDDGVRGVGRMEMNEISIINEVGRVQDVSFDNVNCFSNFIVANKASTVSVICDKNGSEWELGFLKALHVKESVTVDFIDGGNFSAVINASYVQGTVTVNIGEEADANGLFLLAQQAYAVRVDVYGRMRDHNVLNASSSFSFDLTCHNPKSCSGPSLEVVSSPRHTRINCVGTACDRMTLHVDQTADEIDFSMTYCDCDDERKTLCITEWLLVCADDQASTIKDAQCYGQCCGNVVNQLQAEYPSPYDCPLSTKTEFICQENLDCVVDCMNTTQFGMASPFECGGNASTIDASRALSLGVKCADDDAICKSLAVTCPMSSGVLANTSCQVDCSETNACQDMDIITMQSDSVVLNCLADASCNTVMIDNSAVNGSASGESNSITVNCTDAICEAVTVLALDAIVSFECVRSGCISANISNSNSVEVKIISGVFQDSNITASSVALLGSNLNISRTLVSFTDALADLVISSTQDSVIDQLTVSEVIIPSDNSSTVVNNTYRITATNLVFSQQLAQISVTKALNFTLEIPMELSLVNKQIKLNDPQTSFILNDFGSLNKTNISIESAESFYFACLADNMNSNSFSIDNTSQVTLIMTACSLNGKKTPLNIGNVSNLMIYTGQSNFTNYVFNEKLFNPESVLMQHLDLDDALVAENITVNASNAVSFSLNCYGSNCGRNSIIETPNMYDLTNVSNVTIKLGGKGTFDPNVLQLKMSNTKHLMFEAYDQAEWNSIYVTESLESLQMYATSFGVFRNVSVGSDSNYSIELLNVTVTYEGIVESLSVKPIGVIKTMLFDVSGRLVESTIDASKSSLFEMVCNNTGMSGGNDVCDGISLYVADGGNVSDVDYTLTCANTACQSFEFFTVNGMDDVEVMLEDCPCDVAIHTSCLSKDKTWKIHCDETDKVSVFVDNKCAGECCGDVVEELEVKTCNYHPGSKKKSGGNAGAVVGGICGGILFLVLVGAGLYYYKKKKRAEEESQRLLLNDD